LGNDMGGMDGEGLVPYGKVWRGVFGGDGCILSPAGEWMDTLLISSDLI
jgi:hypothetical protein